jgi:CubicO group peptidase (beta-lactamase class C family)
MIVVKEGRTVFRTAYGDADVARHQPMTPAMSLRIGSMTKQFTAVAILMLVEEGKLGLNDPLTRFFPDYPAKAGRITIEHLLTHTSGIASPHLTPEEDAKAVTPAQLVERIKAYPIVAEPGAQWAYSNSGYRLLGAIIEKTAGMSYAKFLEQRIFLPLGMSQTAYAGHERGPTLRAAGHRPASAGVEPSAAIDMSRPYSAGALVSTVDDLARWDNAISAGKLIGAAGWQRAFTAYTLTDGSPAGPNAGYGFFNDTLQGARMSWHGGDIDGYSAIGLRLPQQKVYVAVLSNLEGSAALTTYVAKKAAAIALGKPLAVRKTVAVDPKLLAAYAGRYQLGADFIFEVSLAGDKFLLKGTGAPTLELAAASDTVFFAEVEDIEVRFDRAPDGAVTQMLFSQGGGQQMTAARLK